MVVLAAKWRRRFWRTVRGGLAEGTQEGFQQWLQNVIAQQIYKPDQDWWEDVAYNALVGAVVGGGVNAAGGHRALPRFRVRRLRGSPPRLRRIWRHRRSRWGRTTEEGPQAQMCRRRRTGGVWLVIPLEAGLTAARTAPTWVEHSVQVPIETPPEGGAVPVTPTPPSRLECRRSR